MKDKNPNVETLNIIYQSSKMGVDAISSLLPKVSNDVMKKELASEMLGYHEFIKSSSNMLHNIHHYPHDINPAVKIPAFISMQIESTLDNSQSNIAEMMIEGSNAGIVELQKQLNSNPNLTEDVQKIASEVISFEESNISKMKLYL